MEKKYYYNPLTCNYEEAKVTRKHFYLKSVGFFVLSLTMAIGLQYLYSNHFDSPKELKIKRENESLKKYYKTLEEKVQEANQILDTLQKRDEQIYRKIYGLASLSSAIRKAGVGGVEAYEELSNQEMIREVFQRVGNLKRKLEIQEGSYKDILHNAEKKRKYLRTIPTIYPVAKKQSRLTSGFGQRQHPIYKKMQFHEGIDIAAPRGTHVYAAADGIVKKAKIGPLGLTVLEIRHYNSGYHTKYLHLDKFLVKPNQEVKAGEVIGLVGDQGVSTACHLHYEVIKHGKKVNPIDYLIKDFTPQEYQEIVYLASLQNESMD